MSERIPRPNSKKRPSYALPGLVAGGIALASFIGAGVGGSGVLDSPADAQAQAEANMIDKMRSGELDTTVSSRVIVLREGVPYYENPVVISADTALDEPGTIAGMVEKGKALVVYKPLETISKDHNTWIGFRITKAEERKGIADSEEIADDLKWVNLTGLSSQTDKAGRSYISIIGEEADYPTLVAHIDEAGNIRLENNRPVAQAQQVDAAQLNFIVRSLR